MKKWFAAIMLSLLLITQLPTIVLAKGNSSVSAVSAYGLQDTLYTFVQMGSNYDGTSMKARITSSATGEEASPVRLVDSDSTVRYLLMVDLSGSMKNHINDVNDFVRSLMEQEKKDAVFTVAAFGERFETKAENLTDEKAVIEALNNLEYNEQITNPYDGMVKALAYLNSCPRLGGECVNLILITDGKPDLGYEDKTSEAEAETTEAKAAAEKIANTPEVAVHTFGFNQWSETALSTFSTGTGLNVEAGSQSTIDAAEAGKQIAEYVDGLYRTDFPLSGAEAGKRLDIKLSFTGQTLDGQYAVPEVELHSVPVLQNASSPAAIQPPSVSETENPSQTDTSPPEETSQESTKEDAQQKKTEEKEKKTGIPQKGNFLPALLFAAVAILLILVLFLVKKKTSSQSKRLRQDIGKKTINQSSIFMRIEVISGQYTGKSSELYLQDELLIGSSSHCDIVWKDEGIAPENSRIFIKDQIVYIEDLNSPFGTTLGGMRLYSANRLRSGDEISIGTVHFRIRF